MKSLLLVHRHFLLWTEIKVPGENFCSQSGDHKPFQLPLLNGSEN